MKNSTFNKLLKVVPELNHDQRFCLKSELNQCDDYAKICDLLERRIEDNYRCVHCNSTKIIKFGHRAGLNRYRCKSCSRTFNALTGTPLARLRKKELWLKFIELLVESFTIRKSARKVKVNLKTTFNWRHRFLKKSHDMENQLLSGIVEADETFFRQSMKGSKKLKRPPRKRGEAAPQRGLSKAHVSVVVLCSRNHQEADYITGLGSVNSKWLDQFLAPHIEKDALLVTDKASAFKTFSSHQLLKHKTISATRKGERVDGIYHIQHVNSYHSGLKGWMYRFHGVATKYLNHYLGWFHLLRQVHTLTAESLILCVLKFKQPLTGT